MIGLFWGAPLIARELESGSFRLAWNQSVTREHWLAVKLGVLGLASMAAAGLLSLILGWWASPIDDAARAAGAGASRAASSRWTSAPAGSCPSDTRRSRSSLGVLIGLMIRRTVPAMAITLAIFAVVQIAMPLWIRPHLITPVRSTIALTASQHPGARDESERQPVRACLSPGPRPARRLDLSPTRSRRRPARRRSARSPQACQSQQGPQGCINALAQMHLKQVVIYQPANRYWTFQWLETGIYLTVAILLAWGCFWWVRRRLS